MSQIKTKLKHEATPQEAFEVFRRIYDATPEGSTFLVEFGEWVFRLRFKPDNQLPEASVAQQRGWAEIAQGKTFEQAVQNLEKKCIADSQPKELPDVDV